VAPAVFRAGPAATAIARPCSGDGLKSRMIRRDDIPVVYENGVFRPETPVDLPERARLRISIHEAAPANGSANGAHEVSLKEAFDDLRARGVVRSGGWRPTRDELHERR